MRVIAIVTVVFGLVVPRVVADEPTQYPLVLAGTAKIDITPSYPTRMTGYGARMKEHEAVAMPIFAKAIAIGGATDAAGKVSATPLTVMLSIETCGFGEPTSSQLADKICKAHGIERERFVLSATHSHTAPWLRDFAPNIFPPPLPDEHTKHLDQYDAELTEKALNVVGEAIKARQPSRLAWAQTTAPLNVNRRVLKGGKWAGFGNQKDGPVDQRLPVLAVHGEDGKLRALWCNYAMHCTVHGGGFNQISGDWAGAAMEFVENDHPGTTCLITIGCGADQGPRLNGGLGEAKVLGREFADAVKGVVAGSLRAPAAESRSDSATFKPLNPQIACKLMRVELPFATTPSREQLEAQAKQSGVAGSNAKYFLSQLDAGKEVPKSMTYPVGVWSFGHDLAMVFLGGEVVVDYSLRMQSEFDPSRVWITAYANDVPSYIASKRVLIEAGYEADFSMLYYRRPSRLSPDAEDVVIDSVQKLLPHEFYSAEKQAAFPKPKSPEESLASIKVRPGLKMELVAAEPLIQDPVAFEWDEQGRLWVVEMRDYPNGVMTAEGQAFQNDDLRGQPGGRIKILTDDNGDGRYDSATTFLDGIAFPSGIQRWRNGVLVTAAPDVFFAEDTNGDGKADVKQVLFKGFGQGNQQHRVNGLRYGLDNWVYIGNGDSGGEIEAVGALSERQGASRRSDTDADPRLAPRGSVSIRGRDARINPDLGLIEPLSGQTQFGRERNDSGDWFGNNNSRPIWHYALDDHYLRRNSHLAVRDTKFEIAEVPGAAPVFPLSKTLARFNDFDRANRFTSACSTTIYRDRVLGEQFIGNAFVCEPVHNLVSRLVLTADGASFKARRTDDEQDSEFLASSDNWFRPVMIRTGPDGALWIADMYRAVIEHPRWIPPEWQRKLDLRAGSDRGRIYRILECGDSSPLCLSAKPSLSSSDSEKTQKDSDDAADKEAKKKIGSANKESGDESPHSKMLAKLASSNGWWRDTAQRKLVESGDVSLIAPLSELAKSHAEPLARLHALCAIDGLCRGVAPQLPSELRSNSATMKAVVIAATNDKAAIVRRHAIRLSEKFLDDSDVRAALKQRVNDEPQVVMQLAYSLGEAARFDAALPLKSPSPPAPLPGVPGRGEKAESGSPVSGLLADIAVQHANDSLISTAVLSSLNADNVAAVEGHIASLIVQQGKAPKAELFALLGRVSAQSVALSNGKLSAQALQQLLPQDAQAAASVSPSSLFPVLRQVLGNAKTEELEKAAFVQPGWRLVADRARQTAASSTAETKDRIASLELLSISKQWNDSDIALFRDRTAPREPIEVQQAAINGLVASGRVDAVTSLLGNWKTFGPQTRNAVLDALLGREPTTHALLEQLERGTLTTSDFDAARRERLLSHKNSAIKVRAAKLLAVSGVASSRQAVIDQFKSVLTLKGDVARGRMVFEKRCSACHKFDGIGKQLGADLGAVKDKSATALLTAILDPNRAVEARYFSYVIQNTDGRSFSGMLTSEAGNSVTLVGVDGKETVLLRNDIEELVTSQKSFMPEGIEKDMTPTDLADVIAFVQGPTGMTPSERQGASRRSETEPRPAASAVRLITAETDGSLHLVASAAELRGPKIVFEKQFQNLGYWQSADDVASWTIEVTKPGKYDLSMTYASEATASGDRFEVSIGEQKIEGTAASTRVWENYRSTKLGTVDLTAGKHRVVMRPLGKPKFALLDLKELRLTP